MNHSIPIVKKVKITIETPEKPFLLVLQDSPMKSVKMVTATIACLIEEVNKEVIVGSISSEVLTAHRAVK